MLVLGYGSGTRLSLLLTVAGLVVLSITWHELGHALAFKSFGHDPQIQLMGIFGLTWSSDPSKRLSNGQKLVVAAAGPAAGLLLAGVCYLLREALMPGDPLWIYTMLTHLVLINLILNLFNLLPAVPLDGGHILKSVLDIAAPEWGSKIAHGVSLVVVTAAIWWAMKNDYEVTALLLLGIASLNFTALRSKERIDFL
jgi:stage IV sporulation protein FB